MGDARPWKNTDVLDVFGVLKKYGHQRLELEFRLGHRLAGKFVPGVVESSWVALKNTLDNSPHFDVVITKTRELICDGGGKYVISVDPAERAPHWMYKKRILDRDVDTGTAWSGRMSVSIEETEAAPGPPAKHSFERCKERWSFVHKCWSIDLTRVQSNLPHQLDNDGWSYEVEVELKDATELFARPLEHILEWGWSIVNDLTRMCTEPV